MALSLDPTYPIPVGKIPDGGTQILAYKETENETETVYTVTAGKTLYLCSVVVTIRNGSGGPVNVFVRILTDAALVKFYLIYSRVPDDAYISTPYLFFPPMELGPGWTFQADSEATNCKIMTSVYGYEIGP